MEKWSPKTKVSSSKKTTISLSFPLSFRDFFIYFYLLILEYAWNLIVQWCNARFNKKNLSVESWYATKNVADDKKKKHCTRNSTFYFQGPQEHAAYQNILSRGRREV